MGKPSDVMEHNISPWLRLVTPILLALIMFILNGMNDQLSRQTAELAKVKSDLAVLASRISANETAIRYIDNDR